MNKKSILIFEKYDGVRFVLERSLTKYKDDLDIFASHWKDEIKSHIKNNQVDLLITELSKFNPDGLEISSYARKMAPELQIIWITVLGCDNFREQKEKFGNIKCLEKPLGIKNFRKNILQALNIFVLNTEPKSIAQQDGEWRKDCLPKVKLPTDLDW